MSTTSSTETLGATPAPQALLRARIGWMCHLIRIAAVLWAAWNLMNLVRNFYSLDPAQLTQTLNSALKAGLGEISHAQIAAALGIGLGIWTLDAVIALCVWRLGATYLNGRIFTVDAAIWMRRIGVIGLVAVLATVAWRKAALFIYTVHGHVPIAALLFIQPLVTPADLLRLVFCLFMIVLAYIFKAAAELADDHAGIV